MPLTLIVAVLAAVLPLCAQAPPAREVKADKPPVPLSLGRGVQMEFVRIPPGEFVMGSPGGRPATHKRCSTIF